MRVDRPASRQSRPCQSGSVRLFGFTGIAVRLPPESPFGFRRNRCSASTGITVRDAPEHAPQIELRTSYIAASKTASDDHRVFEVDVLHTREREIDIHDLRAREVSTLQSGPGQIAANELRDRQFRIGQIDVPQVAGLGALPRATLLASPAGSSAL